MSSYYNGIPIKNKYRITINGKGTHVENAANPMAALRQIRRYWWNCKVDFVPADKTMYEVKVELLEGKRASVSYYRVLRR